MVALFLQKKTEIGVYSFSCLGGNFQPEQPNNECLVISPLLSQLDPGNQTFSLIKICLSFFSIRQDHRACIFYRITFNFCYFSQWREHYYHKLKIISSFLKSSNFRNINLSLKGYKKGVVHAS